MEYKQIHGSSAGRSAGTLLDIPWTVRNGRAAQCTCLPMVEEWLKDEINARKNCGCTACEYSKNMLRELQHIVQVYSKTEEGMSRRCDRADSCDKIRNKL